MEQVVAYVKTATLIGVLMVFLYKRYGARKQHMASLMKRYYLLASVGLVFLLVNPCAFIIMGEADLKNNETRTLNKTIVEVCDTIGFGACSISMIMFFLFMLKCTVEKSDTTREEFRYLRSTRLIFVLTCAICVCIQAILAIAELPVSNGHPTVAFIKHFAHLILLGLFAFMSGWLCYAVKTHPDFVEIYKEFWIQLFANLWIIGLDLVFYFIFKFVLSASPVWARLLDFLACGPILFNSLVMSTYDPKIPQPLIDPRNDDEPHDEYHPPMPEVKEMQEHNP